MRTIYHHPDGLTIAVTNEGLHVTVQPSGGIGHHPPVTVTLPRRTAGRELAGAISGAYYLLTNRELDADDLGPVKHWADAVEGYPTTSPMTIPHMFGVEKPKEDS